MPENTYIAELSLAEYDRFRERDADLPATYKEWHAGHIQRINAMRRSRQIPISYPIDFADCAETLRILRQPHNQANRDDYAQTQGMIEEGEKRRRQI